MKEFMYTPLREHSPVLNEYGTFAWRFRSAPRRLAGMSVVMLWLLIFLLSWAPQAMGQEEELSGDTLIELSLDELLNVEFYTTLEFVDELEGIGIDESFSLDARLAWRPREDLELAIVGQNLFDSERFEFLELVRRPVSTGLQRSVYGKVTWKF